MKIKYNIPEGKNILLYVGRLDKEKNIDLVMKGFSQASKKLNLHFVIAGKGAEEDGRRLLNHAHHQEVG